MGEVDAPVNRGAPSGGLGGGYGHPMSNSDSSGTPIGVGGADDLGRHQDSGSYGSSGGLARQVVVDDTANKQFLQFLETYQETVEAIDEATGNPIEITEHAYVEEALRLRKQSDDTYSGVDGLGRAQQTLVVNMQDIPSALRRYIIQNFERLFDALESTVETFVKTVGADRADGTDVPALDDQSPHRFFLRFSNSSLKSRSIREIRCEDIGRFIAITGQVTRESDVHPELIIGNFKCKTCGAVTPHVAQMHKYTTPVRCSNERCSSRFDFELQADDSKFGDFQKIRIQESAQEAGAGAIPRALEIILRNELVDKAHAGDEVVITGSLIVVPMMPALLKRGEVSRGLMKQLRSGENNVTQGVSGMKFIGVREIKHRVCFLANNVERVSTGQKLLDIESLWNSKTTISPDEVFAKLPWVAEVANHPNTLYKLAELIAPRVYGASEIKLGILLMLTGGIQKVTSNCKLRGDINICIVGDPSTGKSQLLKFVESFSNRAIFTSGKGSTAAGLTAAVRRDPETGETVMEAGALMYADQGVCCIDEFDKMNEKDRVSIHEAMEQQTISISKAGIQATLNARACILAGCNPRFGKYDRSKTFAQNVNIPSPLLSRFDLFFVTVDELNDEKDRSVASHLVDNYIDSAEPQPEHGEGSAFLTLEELQIYIELARHTKPVLTMEAKEMLIDFYVSLRTDEILSSQRSMRITVRQLEALVRLSEAVAKLKFSPNVDKEHVTIACDVFAASLKKVTNTSKTMEKVAPKIDDENLEPKADFASLNFTYEEFKRVRDRLLDRVHEYQETTNGLMPDNELKEWYVENFVQTSEGLTAEQLRDWWPKLDEIISRLIHSDSALIHQPSTSPDDDTIYVGVHPNIESMFVLPEGAAKPRNSFFSEASVDLDGDGLPGEDHKSTGFVDDVDFLEYEASLNRIEDTENIPPDE